MFSKQWFMRIHFIGALGENSPQMNLTLTVSVLCVFVQILTLDYIAHVCSRNNEAFLLC